MDDLTKDAERWRSRVALGVRVCVGVGLAAASGWLALQAGEPAVLHALGAGRADADGDGLADALERAIGSRPDRLDSDLDGFWDSEELARGSRWDDAQSVPAGDGIAVAMQGYQDGSDIHLATVTYLPDGQVAGKKIQYVTTSGVTLVPVPSTWLAGGAPMQVRPASGGTGVVVVLDPVVSPDVVFTKHNFSLAAVVSHAGVNVAADAVNLAAVQGFLYEHLPTLPRQGSGLLEFGAVPGVGIGGAYAPLAGSDAANEPTTGEICAQSTVITAVVGGIVTQEVVDADCVAGSAFCAPGCLATIGARTRFIDPAALIGN